MTVNFPAMSWLLAVCIPGILMASTLAMQRLESALHTAGPTPVQTLARLEQAARAARERAAQRTLTDLPVTGSVSDIARRLIDDEPGLPTKPQTRIRLHAVRAAPTPPNPRFHPSGMANRV